MMPTKGIHEMRGDPIDIAMHRETCIERLEDISEREHFIVGYWENGRKIFKNVLSTNDFYICVSYVN